MPRKRSVYDVTITQVAPAEHPKGLVTYQVFWETTLDNGVTVDGVAKTVPGALSVNYDPERWTRTSQPAPVDIIMNGRGQIISIKRHGS